jgi:anti-anti-sigma factor
LGLFVSIRTKRSIESGVGVLMTSPIERSRLSVEHMPGGVLVRLIDCEMLHEETIPTVREQLQRLAEERAPARLMLDLEGIRFMTSTGLGMLVGLHKKVQALGGCLTLCGLNPQVRELFEVTQLYRVLDIRSEDTLQGAE